jgi:D-2-hydroxyacid dehydrogenase (NADP+)
MPDQSLNVLVSGDLPEDAVAGLASVDPRLTVSQLNALERGFFASGRSVSAHDADPLRQAIARRLENAEVLITFPQAPVDLSTSVPRLRWLQLLTAGADELPDLELLKRVPVTTLRGVRARAVAEYTLMLMLALAKNLPRSLELAKQHAWERVPVRELDGWTAGIVGVGSIGSEVARLCKAFDMHVIGIRRGPDRRPDDCADEILAPRELPVLLSASDVVVIAAPSTTETRHLLGEEQLRLMRPGAMLINVARGALVDEAALVRALREGWIAGAAIDVTQQEPLPADSPLYVTPNLILTSHNAGMTDRFVERALPVLQENLRRFLSGRPLLNQIDPRRGY